MIAPTTLELDSQPMTNYVFKMILLVLRTRLLPPFGDSVQNTRANSPRAFIAKNEFDHRRVT